MCVLESPTECPQAVVTSDRNLGGVKQHRLILSWFWRPEVQIQSHRQGSALSGGARGEYFPPLPISGGCRPAF